MSVVLPGFGAMLLERLAELHDAGIILRVLTPERVYLDGERLVLTDFELAKLVRSTLSVSGLWESQNVYRAPEVDDRNPRVHVNRMELGSSTFNYK